MAKRASARRVKSHRTYSIPEAAEVTGVTVQTVRTWRRKGLRVMSAQRPYLILGADLKAFLSETTAAAKRPLPFGAFYCLSCKGPQPPALDFAEYHPLSASHGRLAAFCATCEGPCSRIVKRADLPAWRAIYEIGGERD